MIDKAPKVFISYSWSTSEHEIWVERFAKELVAAGIDVVLDKWGLDVGNDVNAFMEQMVTDPDITKVVMVFDETYATKSNRRTGGVGTEAQIITPNLYGAVDQTKFIGIVRERGSDGKAHVPAYYATRRYIDLSDPGRYAEEFKTLIRTIYGQPLYVKPALGAKPAWLDQPAAASLPTTASLQLAVEAIKAGNDRSELLAEEFLSVVLMELEKFRISGGDSEFDEKVFTSITNFVPYRDEVVSLFVTAAAYRPTVDMASVFHRFFERLIPFNHPKPNTASFFKWDFDNFKFIGWELFLYCVGALIARERFYMAAHLIQTGYYVGDIQGNRREPMASFDEFYNYLQSFENRAHRLGKSRVLQAIVLQERCTAVGVEFKHIMTADLILWLAGRKAGTYWYPLTLFYAAHHAVTFEIFARASSAAYFDRIKGMLGVANKAEFESLIASISESGQIPKFDWESIDPAEITQLASLVTRP